jgi:hypothetical protein
MIVCGVRSMNFLAPVAARNDSDRVESGGRSPPLQHVLIETIEASAMSRMCFRQHLSFLHFA